MRLSIDVDAIRADAEALARESLSATSRNHSDVLTAIINKLERLDFHELSGIDPPKPVPLKAQIVLTVAEVLRVAREINCGLCRDQAFVYTYNGEYWQLLNKDELESFLGEAADRCGMYWIDAKHFETKAKLAKQFLSDAYLPKPTRSDDRVLINLQNGTCEIGDDGRVILRGFDPSDFLTYQLPFEYDHKAKYPKWQGFLDEVLPDPDRSRQRILAEFLGYVFARRLKLEKCLILYGLGANGKSVVFEVTTALLGPENVSNVSLESLSRSDYYRATIANSRLNYSSEISIRLQAEKFKQLTSGEPIEARLPYGQPMTLTNYARLAFNTNELPRDVEHTEAFFRRFLIIPFDVTIPPESRDTDLAKTIIDGELAGVFNWMLDGLNRLVTMKRFSTSEPVDNALSTFRRESDSVAMFIEDESYSNSVETYIYQKVLYPQYRAYCNDNGFKPCGSTTMGKRLEALGFFTDKGTHGKRIFIKKNV